MKIKKILPPFLGVIGTLAIIIKTIMIGLYHIEINAGKASDLDSFSSVMIILAFAFGYVLYYVANKALNNNHQ